MRYGPARSRRRRRRRQRVPQMGIECAHPRVHYFSRLGSRGATLCLSTRISARVSARALSRARYLP